MTATDNTGSGELVVDDAATASRATVSVIIPVFNQARFLAEAITSVLEQTRQADEIIVVDDGSTDDPESVVARFQNVRLLRQTNRGPSAARNLGIRSCKADCIIFLDADDRLLPIAIEAGLACMAARPDHAFVYGGHHQISQDGQVISSDAVLPIVGDPFIALIRRNLIPLPATVLFRRDCLLAVKGFDETLRQAEDYDLYFRAAERYPIASHEKIVAEYRKHSQSASSDHIAALQAMLGVLHRHEARLNRNPQMRVAFRQGRARVTNYRVSELLITAMARWYDSHDVTRLMKDMIQATRCSPSATFHVLVRAVGRCAVKMPLHAIVRCCERIFIAAA
jgi:glycosyltransferase involved in cell wall biosynthesis